MKCRDLALLTAVAILSGCGGREHTSTYSTPQGTVTVKQDAKKDGGGTLTVTGPQGQSTMTSNNGNVTSTSTDANGKTSTVAIGSQVDLSQLGVKVYPGATAKPSTSVKTDTPDGASMAVQLESKDDPAKIMDFYKAEIKAKSTTTTPQGGVMSGTTASGDEVVVMVTKGETSNNIGLTVVHKKKQ